MKRRSFSNLSLVIFIFVSFFICCQGANAQGSIDIENDTTWRKGDDLNFTGTVFVWPGATLTIEKGANITLEEDADGNAAYMDISGGRIIANGTLEEPIKITSTASQNSYHIIEFRGNSVWTDMSKPEPSFFRHVEISGGGYEADNSCPGPGCEAFFPFISSALAFDDGGPAFRFYNGKVHMENCRFHNNKFADVGVEFWEGDEETGEDNYVEIVNSNFEKNGDALAVNSQIQCKVAGMSCMKKIYLKNNWYDDIDGPSGDDLDGGGKGVEGVFYLDGWKKSGLIIDPAIVIPGITGSMPSRILAGELVLDPILHIYDNLMASLDENGYEKNKNLFDFPYQWRDGNIITADELGKKIESIKNDTKISKVDIVAHSMGGLLARQYIESANYQNDIDQLITLGTPHKGAPKSYLMWEAGEGFFTNIEILTQKIFALEAHALGYDSLQEYIQARVVSVGELLPDYSYLEKDGEMKNYPTGYPRNTFLEALNSQPKLNNLSKVNFYNIIGDAGLNKTINKFRVVDSTVSGNWEHGMPENFYDKSTDQGIEYGIGDKTVPLSSTDGIVANKKIEIDSIHSDLPTKAQCYVVEELTGKDDCEYISTFDRAVDILSFGVFSPIDIQVVAPDGKRMGKNFATGGEYDEISGAYYSGYDTDSEFLTIPNPKDGEYKILTQGTDNGAYKIEVAKISEDENNLGVGSTAVISGTATVDNQEELKVEVSGNEVIVGEQDKIPPTASSIISDINHYYKLKLITSIGTRNYLLAKLRIIKGEIRILEELKKSSLPKKSKEKLIGVVRKIVNLEIDLLIRQVQKEKNLVKTIDPKVRNLLVESLEDIKQ